MRVIDAVVHFQLYFAEISGICTYSECFKSENVMFLASPDHNQNWIYDFLSDWLTQNQNIA